MLLDRLGGSATVSQADFEALRAKYDGHMGVKASLDRTGVYRLTLTRVERPPEPLPD